MYYPVVFKYLVNVINTFRFSVVCHRVYLGELGKRIPYIFQCYEPGFERIVSVVSGFDGINGFLPCFQYRRDSIPPFRSHLIVFRSKR